MTLVYFFSLSKRTIPDDFLRCYKQDPMSFDRGSANGKMVVDIACLGGNLEMVEFLLQHQSAAFSLPPKSGNTPVHSAVFSDNVQIIDALFQDGFDIHAVTDDGSTPLHATVWLAELLSWKSYSTSAQNPISLSSEGMGISARRSKK